MTNPKTISRKGRAAAAVISSALCLILILLSVFLIDSVQKSMWNNACHHIMEMTSRSAAILSTRVEAELRGLRDLGKGLSVDSADVADILSAYQQEHSLPDLAIAGPDGRGINADGAPVDYSSQEKFSPTLMGESSVSNPYLDQTAGWCISIQVPLFSKGAIRGALFADCALDTFYPDYAIDFYEGQGFCHTVDRNGILILAAQNDPASVSDNLFDYLYQENPRETVQGLADCLKNQTSGEFVLTYLGKPTFFGCVPVGNQDDWSVISIIPSTAIQSESRHVVAVTLTICTAILSCFLLIAFVFLRNTRLYNRRLLHLTYIDPVTGGANFAKFKLDAQALLHKNSHTKFAVFYFDIKNFKYINDIYGFTKGDLVLRHIYEILSKDKWQGTAARLNGDTFVYLCCYDQDDALLSHYEVLRDRICNLTSIMEDSSPITIYTGIYCTEGNPEHLSINDMIDRANIAQKKAKDMIVGGYSIYTEESRRTLMEEQELENQMHKALKQGEFVVYLQPKYNVRSDSAVAAEALVRWEHPTLGLIPPGKFIPLFERNGFIQELDTYMFEQVCRLLRRWIDKGLRPLPVSVNVSRLQLNNDHFLQKYFDIRNTWKIPDQLIEIEFTESLVFENAEKMASILNTFHANGFLCSIDDFGSGYSSLNLLKDLPVDTLKLDKVFFDQGSYQEREHIIIRSIIAMGAKLSMQTIAEGIERWDQVEFLREAGCDLIQGYVYDKPLPSSAFEKKYIEPN